MGLSGVKHAECLCPACLRQSEWQTALWGLCLGPHPYCSSTENAKDGKPCSSADSDAEESWGSPSSSSSTYFNLLFIFICFKEDFIILCVWVFSARNVCPCMYAVLLETRRGRQIDWTWSYSCHVGYKDRTLVL